MSPLSRATRRPRSLRSPRGPGRRGRRSTPTSPISKTASWPPTNTAPAFCSPGCARPSGAEQCWRDALKAGLQVLFQALAAEPAFARTCVMQTGSAAPRVRRARLKIMSNFRDFFNGPGVPPIPGTIRDAVISGIYTTIHTYIEADRTAELPGLLPAMSFFALLPFVSRDEAAEELLGR